MSSYSPNPSDTGLVRLTNLDPELTRSPINWLYGQVFAAAIFLISVPVFFEAPLVRSLPWLSLVMTAGWFALGYWWLQRPARSLWGDLIIGFAWTWLAGAIYWGWFRLEPLWHLPIEAIGVPFAWWCISRQHAKVGHYFYLGSLLGTSLTDVYFYLAGLVPYWRQLVITDLNAVGDLLRQAIAQATTPWGVSWAIILGCLLILVGTIPLSRPQLHWWAFSGAVLSTILVDGLFFGTAFWAAQLTY